MNKEISQNNHSEEQKQNAGFCGGCRSNFFVMVVKILIVLRVNVSVYQR
jgi:hypothetical protein